MCDATKIGEADVAVTVGVKLGEGALKKLETMNHEVSELVEAHALVLIQVHPVKKGVGRLARARKTEQAQCFAELRSSECATLICID